MYNTIKNGWEDKLINETIQRDNQGKGLRPSRWNRHTQRSKEFDQLEASKTPKRSE